MEVCVRQPLALVPAKLSIKSVLSVCESLLMGSMCASENAVMAAIMSEMLLANAASTSFRLSVSLEAQSRPENRDATAAAASYVRAVLLTDRRLPT